jgi:hypothetical protein
MVSQRLGLSFSDGSLLVLPLGTDTETAFREAAEHDIAEREAHTQVVRLRIEIVERLERG